MKKLDWLIIFFLIPSYLILLYFFKPQVFNYRFSLETVNRYMCSQDIPYEPPCRRLIISDEEIYIGAGYLYAKGKDPSLINFQHMPFITWLYGITSIYFKNPYYLEFFFGIVYLILIYYLGKKIFNKRLISILAIFLILIDPLFLDISTQASLDLGQAVFNLLYFISLFIWKNWFLAGVFLAMFAGSKFYGAVIFFAFIYFFYLYLKKQINWKNILFHLVVAFFIFNLFYLSSYQNQGIKFNIFLFQLKVIKFWINHSLTNFPFASILLFTFGIFKKWWGDYQFTFSHIYSPLWPVSLFASLYLTKINLFNNLFFLKRSKKNSKIKLSCLFNFFYNSKSYFLKIKNKIELKDVIFLITPLYLLYLGSQIPFPRYFIILLPFSYLTLAYFINKKLLD